jgi:drug/metabolite transporter (DMT)-like permease
MILAFHREVGAGFDRRATWGKIQAAMNTLPPKPALPPFLVLAFGILAASTASIFIRYAQEEAPSLAIAAWRMSLAALILLPMAVTRRRSELKRLSRAHLGLALLSGVFLALHFATWISSLAYTSVASSVVFVDTVPLWVAIAAPLIGERIPRPVWIGLGLAFAGGVVVALSDACSLSGQGLACPPLSEFVGGKAFLGDMLALAGAITAAAYLLIGRRVREQVSLLSYIFLVYGAAALVLVAMLLVSGQPVFGYPAITYLWFLLLALVPQLLGHSSYNWALAYLPAAFVSLTLLGEPIGSTLLAVLLLGEAPTLLRLGGMALILAGIYAASRNS